MADEELTEEKINEVLDRWRHENRACSEGVAGFRRSMGISASRRTRIRVSVEVTMTIPEERANYQARLPYREQIDAAIQAVEWREGVVIHGVSSTSANI